MANTYDQTFENNKKPFKDKFKKEWHEDPSLYLLYIQTLYADVTFQALNNGLGRIVTFQETIMRSIQNISNKLNQEK